MMLQVFVSPVFGKILLVLQLGLLLSFIFFRWTQPMGGIWTVVQSDPFAPKPRNLLVRMFDWFAIRDEYVKLTPEHILTTLFTSNFIGVACSRSIHYQYYCWYYHTLPYLLWRTELPVLCVSFVNHHVIQKLILFGCFELVYNVYPSTPTSSLLFQCSHICLLACLWMRKTDQSCKMYYDRTIFRCGGTKRKRGIECLLHTFTFIHFTHQQKYCCQWNTNDELDASPNLLITQNPTSFTINRLFSLLLYSFQIIICF